MDDVIGGGVKGNLYLTQSFLGKEHAKSSLGINFGFRNPSYLTVVFVELLKWVKRYIISFKWYNGITNLLCKKPCSTDSRKVCGEDKHWQLG